MITKKTDFNTHLVPTVHNEAQFGEMAKIVIMPGDPVRAEWIAKNYLDSPKLVNSVRSINGFTGTLDGFPVSVMASGMGLSSIALYSHELFNFYDVDLIIRAGTAGTMMTDIDVGDIIIADSACTDAAIVQNLGFPDGYIPKADMEIVNLLKQSYNERKKDCSDKTCHIGMAFSTELFYGLPGVNEKYAEKGACCIDMESAALFAVAEKAGKKAASVFTISDNIPNRTLMAHKDRATALTEMLEIIRLAIKKYITKK